ncbi:MAG: alkaline phosphatase family protein, partial [Candidatus Promineifilaceae bacterium]
MQASKTLLVGLDAASWNYLDPLLAAGELPVLADLRQRGYRGNLRSTQPALTPTAWSSILTGVN